MKTKSLILLLGLLCSVTTVAQIASTTQFGLVKVGSGWSVDASGYANVNASSSSTTYSNTAITQASLQAAITAASDYSTVLIKPGTYTLTSPLSFQGKTGVTLSGSTYQVTLTSSTTSNLMLLSGTLKYCRITGIRFAPTYSGTGESMLTTDQTIQGNDLEVDHNYFTGNVTGNYNAIGWVPVDASIGNSRVFSNLHYHHNVIENIPRCGIELLNQKNDVYRLIDVTIDFNTIRNTGANANSYGMATSCSGAIDGIIFSHNTIDGFHDYGFEAINGRRIVCSANLIYSNDPNSAGVSINAQADPNGLSILNERVRISENNITVRYSPIQVSDVNNVNISNNDMVNFNTSNLSQGGVRLVRCSKGTFTGNDLKASSYNALTLTITSDFEVTGNYLSNELYTGSNVYQVVWLYYTGCTGNRIENNKYKKASASGQTSLQNYVWESDGATANIWSDEIAGQGFLHLDGTRHWLRVSSSGQMDLSTSAY